MDQVGFVHMADGTREDYAFLDAMEAKFTADLVDRLIAHLQALDSSISGYKVSRLGHSLQSSTRAHRAGESEEMVVAALLHDIGDMLAPHSHGEMAAAVLRPFVSERTHWIVKHHGLFQMYYYAHFSGGDPNARDRYKDHPCYADTIRFCENYDQNCFDPDYNNEPLSFFEPLMRRVFDVDNRHGFEREARYGGS